ncbi:MAG: hypothetical protein KGH78_03635 [Candidatus Micrarchaeota archaeon]|nr:hypothetical protein [Candidatus Micrarchaeota archaeon]
MRMSLHEIRDDILKEAEAKASVISDEGRSEASRILSEAKDSAKRIRDSSKKEISERTHMMRREHQAGVEIERNNTLLLAKEDAIDALVGSVKREVVANIMKAGYERIVKKAISTARELSGETALIIKADSANQKLLGKLGYRAEAGDAKGVVITTRDGSITVDASIDSIIERNEQSIRGAISKELFAEQKPRKEEAKPKAQKPKKAKPAAKKAAKRKRGK